MPTISIIVPVYKVEEYLDECVNSILCQSFADFELILVDDGSPDNSPAICDAWAEKDSRIKVIHKENGGVVSARQTGAAAATGVYISFVDGDDFIAPSMMKQMVQNLEAEQADYAVCGVNLFWPDKTVSEPGISSTLNIHCIQKDLIPAYVGTESQNCPVKGYACASVCRRELSQSSISLVPTQLKTREDRLQVLHILAGCSKIVTMEECFYYYRQRESSASNRAFAFSGENALLFWNEFSKAAESYGYSCGDVPGRIELEKVRLISRAFLSEKNFAQKCREISGLRSLVKPKRNLLYYAGPTVYDRVIAFCTLLRLHAVLVAVYSAIQKIRRTVCAK